MNYYNCCKSAEKAGALIANTTTTTTISVSAALCYCLLLYRAALAPMCSLGLDALGGVGPYLHLAPRRSRCAFRLVDLRLELLDVHFPSYQILLVLLPSFGAAAYLRRLRWRTSGSGRT